MKRAFFVILAAACLISCARGAQAKCLTGAFLADRPVAGNIRQFELEYGKKPYLVMVFVDWGAYIDEQVIKDVYAQDCVLFVTWEPWRAARKKRINCNKILSGKYDRYIKSFAGRLKKIKKKVFLRFGHEMNGNWYPWSGIKIGQERYKAIYRYVKDTFDSEGVENIEWVFSINWENIPRKNDYSLYYPGDSYVDYIGIDGYNWGKTQSWSRWMGFKDIFFKRYKEIGARFQKPVLISEFGCADKGGDKAVWIKDALRAIKKMKEVKGFVLFNVDKEADWRFRIDSPAGKELKKQLKGGYFRDRE
jgi:beta-mannanase